MVEINEIIEQNPWWRIKNWEEFDKQLITLKNNPFQLKREESTEINNINLIYGPRQVGKTTFLKLMIKKLINSGETPEKIGYFSCDALVSNKREEVREAINFFLEKDIKYLFIDEISNITDWGYEIKYFIDSGKFSSLKVLITGSPFGMKEHLPGRKLAYFYLMPITFREFLINLPSNLNKDVEITFNLKQNEKEEIKALKEVLDNLNFNFTELDKLKLKLKRLEPYFKIINKLFYYYIVIGGFPSVLNSYIRYSVSKNRLYILEESKTNKERLIDTIRKSGKKESISFQLINSIKKRLSSRYSFSQLKETEIDLSKETISNYLNHLKEIFFLKIIYAYNVGKKEIGWKRDKKIYLLDPFLYHEEKIFDSSINDEDYLGKIAESITAINLSYLKEDFFNPLETFLLFWYNSKEIDFIFIDKKLFSIETKFRKKIDKTYKISQIKHYFVLTKKDLKFDKEEMLIPLPLFLSLLKNKKGYL